MTTLFIEVTDLNGAQHVLNAQHIVSVSAPVSGQPSDGLVLYSTSDHYIVIANTYSDFVTFMRGIDRSNDTGVDFATLSPTLEVPTPPPSSR